MQCFIHELKGDALPIYAKNPDLTAYTFGEEGRNILAITKPGRVILPMFDITAPSKAEALSHFRKVLREKQGALMDCLQNEISGFCGGRPEQYTLILAVRPPKMQELPDGSVTAKVGLGLVPLVTKMPFEFDDTDPFIGDKPIEALGELVFGYQHHLVRSAELDQPSLP